MYILNTVLEFVTVLFALGHFKLGYEFTKVNDTTTIKNICIYMNSEVASYLSLTHFINCPSIVSSLGEEEN